MKGDFHAVSTAIKGAKIHYLAHNQYEFTKKTAFLTSSSELAASYVQPFIAFSVLRRNGSFLLSDVL